MKKIICWTLVCAMLFVSLAAAVSAIVFTDADSIGAPYKTAVEQMTALGVLNGFPDGSFQPKGTLTREQGAKIIAYMCLGKDVENLTCSEAPFDDVEADRWSAASIAWCADHGILLGYGDGTFGPEDKLTGDQFAKMLLCAFELGDAARYAGPGWFDAVRVDADALGLYEGDVTMASDLPITREQAGANDAAPGTDGKTEGSEPTGYTGMTGYGGNVSLSWLSYLLGQLAQNSGKTPAEPEVPLTSTGDDITLPDLP